jgi:hypothetical protein
MIMKRLFRNQALDQINVLSLLAIGAMNYYIEFMKPFQIASQSFGCMEQKKLFGKLPLQNISDYIQFMLFNLQIGKTGAEGTLNKYNEFCSNEYWRWLGAVSNSLFGLKNEGILDYLPNLGSDLEGLFFDNPESIRKIGMEFGFHFDDGGYIPVKETDRFILYQVLSRDKTVKTRKDGKPIIIVNPYVLGPNILAFLPGEKKSYVHAFADQGIPTYMRILKDIQTTPAVQIMTGEDDARDTRIFCEKLMAIHGCQVTLNGFCQGGFITLLDILSGELDGLVDALITCVAPMDGTKSESLKEYMQHLPPRFRDLNYALKPTPHGNSIVDGKVMSWVYKLKSMEKEAPLTQLLNDILNVRQKGNKFNKTAAALFHWLIYDRVDLPEGITKLSFDSYTIPVTKDGTLPVKMFGKALNFNGISKRGIKWLLCYAEGDELVDSAAALSPTDFIDVEVTPFPRGHGSIATSWSNPKSACALHTCFGGCRGPVKFQLDLDAEKQVTKRKLRLVA